MPIPHFLGGYVPMYTIFIRIDFNFKSGFLLLENVLMVAIASMSLIMAWQYRHNIPSVKSKNKKEEVTQLLI
jgi:hypothetical protein